MLDKIKAGLLLSLFLAISAGSAAAFLIGPQEFSGQVLGAQCRPAGSPCRRNEECCSHQCYKKNRLLWWMPGRCTPEKSKPSQPSKPPKPTAKPRQPTIKPPRPPRINQCYQLKSLKYRIYWAGRSIDYLCSKNPKSNQNFDCRSLNSIKQSLLSLAQKVDQLYQRCLKEQPKPTISPKPTITPVPTGGVKKCGVNSFGVRDPCPQNGFYKSAYAVCYDGAKFNKEDGCLTSKQWRQQAEVFCKGHCSSSSLTSTPIPTPTPSSPLPTDTPPPRPPG